MALAQSKSWMKLDVAAQYLGVSVAELEQWIATRKISASFEGRACFVSRADVERLSVGRASIEVDDAAESEAAAMLTAALVVDVRTCWEIVSRAVAAQGGLATALETTIVRCLASVGAAWGGGELLVSEEHCVTASMESVIERLRFELRPRTPSKRAACLTLGGDSHDIASRLVQVCLEAEGYWAYRVSGTCPFEDVLLWLSRQPEVSLVCCSVPGTADPVRARAELDTLRLRWSGDIFVGGATGRLGRLPPRMSAVANLHELASALTCLDPNPNG